jgi:hypothetical protein
MESVRRCGRPRSEAGSSLAPGMQGGVATSGPGGGEWRGARARRRARAHTAGPVTACRCRAAGGAAATLGRRGGPPSPGRWPPAPPPVALAPACAGRGGDDRGPGGGGWRGARVRRRVRARTAGPATTEMKNASLYPSLFIRRGRNFPIYIHVGGRNLSILIF